jgi:phosphatidate cytidylyltransferase
MTPGQRLWDPLGAFDDPVTTGIAIALGLLLVVTPLIIVGLHAAGRTDSEHHRELMARYYSWVVLVPILVIPVLLGAAAALTLVCALSLLCYREYARATGLFRCRSIYLLVALGILCVTFASLDHYYLLFVALGPMAVTVIASVAVLLNRPNGYVKRVALAAFGFVVFGMWFGHLGFIANDSNYRAIMLWLFVCVELNDVFAYISGKLFGRHQLCSNTSPNKTVEGALGALVLTTGLVATLGHFVFRGQPIDTIGHLVALGIIVSVGGQLGDLILSSIKRDIGIKDMATTIPGHGGFLDRFDSLVIVSPVLFHFINYFQGVGVDQATNIITGPFGIG